MMLRNDHKTSFAVRSGGFTIMEIAIAMLILSVGLLGVAGLQATGMQSTYQSHQKGVAMVQARDLADRIRANQAGMRGGEYVKSIPTAPTSPDCESAGATCTPAQLAASDLYNWASMSGELLPSGQGSITCTDLDPSTPAVFESGSDCTITMRWDGDRSGATGLGCGGTSADLTCLRLRIVP